MWELWFSAKAICYKINACICMYYIHMQESTTSHFVLCFCAFCSNWNIHYMMTSAIILSRFALLANRYSPGKGSQVISYFRFSAFFGNAYFPRGIRAGVLSKSINLAVGIQYSLWHFHPFKISIMNHIILKQFWMKTFEFAKKPLLCMISKLQCEQLRIWSTILLSWLFLLIHWIWGG